MSIRLKLILLILSISTFVPAVVGYLAYDQSEQVLKSSLESSFAIRLQSLKSQLERDIAALMDNGRSWSKQAIMADIRNGDDDLNILAFLVSNTRSFPVIKDMTVIDGEGEIVASSYEELMDYEDEQMQAFLDRYGFANLNDLEDPAVGLLSNQAEQSYLSLPITDPFSHWGENLGRLLIRIDQKVFNDLFAQASQTEDGKAGLNVYLFSGSNDVIYSSLAADDRFTPELVVKAPRDSLKLKQLKTAFGRLDYEVRRIPAQQSGFKDDLTVIIGQPESTTLAPIRKLAGYILATAIIVTLFASVAGLWLGRGIVSPILALRTTTDNIVTVNDPSLRVPVLTSDEVGSLASSFNSLLDQIERSSRQLEEYNQNLQATVEERTAELSEAKASIDEMLDNMQQGVITFDKDMLINDQASDYTESVLVGGGNPVGQHVIDLVFGNDELSDDEFRRTKFALETLFGSDDFQWSITVDSLPAHIIRKHKETEIYLRLSYQPIYNEQQEITRIMMIIEDETDLVQAQSESQKKQKELQKLSDLLAIDATLLNTFIEESMQQIQESREYIRELKVNTQDQKRVLELIAALFRHMHTIKGSAGLFKLKSIAEVAHEMEDYLGQVQRQEISFDVSVADEINDHLTFVEDEIEAFQELRKEVFGQDKDTVYAERIEALVRLTESMYEEYARLAPKHKNTELFHRQLRLSKYALQSQSFHPYVSTYQNLISQLSDRLEKRLHPLKASIEWPYFDRQLTAKINGFLIHILRNALDHGVEKPAVRLEKGKDEHAQISFRILREQEHVVIELEDDGGGIDGDKLARKAVEKGLISQEQAETLKWDDKLQLLYASGLSTADQVSDISGRGVGLDAVNAVVQELGGSMQIKSTLGKGTCFSIRLPLPIRAGVQGSIKGSTEASLQAGQEAQKSA